MKADRLYTIGFRAETSDLMQKLNGINTEVKRIEKNTEHGISAELAEGARQASILSNALKKATTDKGISFVALETSLKRAGTSATQMAQAFDKSGMQNSINALLAATAQADRKMLSLSSRIKEVGRVLRQSFKYTAAQAAQRFLYTNIQQSVSWVRQLDASLNQIAVVSGKTAAEMDKVFTSVISHSKELKVIAKDYADAALIYYQQGLDIDEVERRTSITIKASKAAGQSVKEMSEQLTAVWNTYQMEGDQLERAASIGAKLGAETAVEFKDIAEAMQISASAASQLGVSYESLTAMIATTGETTKQSASIIGNAFKTIFARFAQLRANGAEGEVQLGLVTKQLKNLGINILDSAGQLRDLDSIIGEVGNSWESYSKKQQVAIAQAVGGRRQYGQFLALMANFDKYKENKASAESEVGARTLEQQYLTAINSVDNKMRRSFEAWNRAFENIFNSENQKGFYEGLELVGDIIGDILKGIGGAKGILQYLGGYLITKIVPIVRELKNLTTTMWDNRSVESRMASASKQFLDIKSGLNDNLKEDGKKYKSGKIDEKEYDRRVTLNRESLAQLDQAEKVEKKLIQLRDLQRNGSVAEKAYAEMKISQLNTIQNELNEEFGALKDLNETTKIRANLTQESSANVLKALNDEIDKRAENIVEAEAEIKLLEEKQKLLKQQSTNSKSTGTERLIARKKLEELEKEQKKNLIDPKQSISTENSIEIQKEEKLLEIEKQKRTVVKDQIKAQSTLNDFLEKTVILSLQEENTRADISGTFGDFKQALETLNGADDKFNLDGLVKEFEEINKEIIEAETSVEGFGKIIMKIMTMLNQSTTNGATLRGALAVEGSSKSAQNQYFNNVKKQVEKAEKVIGKSLNLDANTNTENNTPEKLKELTINYDKMGMAIGRVSMGMTALNNLTESAANGNLPGLLMSLSMLLPTLEVLSTGLITTGVVAKEAEVAIAGFTVSVSALATAGIALLGVGIFAFIKHLKHLKEEIRKNAEENNKLTQSYRENGETVRELKVELENLNTAFNNGEMTLESYQEGIESLREKFNSLTDTIKEAGGSVKNIDFASIYDTEGFMKTLDNLEDRLLKNREELINQTEYNIGKSRDGSLLGTDVTDDDYLVGESFISSDNKDIQEALRTLSTLSEDSSSGLSDLTPGLGDFDYDLREIAKNYELIKDILNETSQEAVDIFRNNMSEIDGFNELLVASNERAALEVEKSLKRIKDKNKDVVSTYQEFNKMFNKVEKLKSEAEDHEKDSDEYQAALIKANKAEVDLKELQLMIARDDSEEGRNLSEALEGYKLLREKLEDSELVEVLKSDQEIKKLHDLIITGRIDLLNSTNIPLTELVRADNLLGEIVVKLGEFNSSGTDEEKIGWFNSYNDSIEETQKQIEAYNKVAKENNWETIDDLEKLTDSFFGLTEAERELLLTEKQRNADSTNKLFQERNIEEIESKIAELEAKKVAQEQDTQNPLSSIMVAGFNAQIKHQITMLKAAQTSLALIMAEQETFFEKSINSLMELDATAFDTSVTGQKVQLDTLNRSINDYNNQIIETFGPDSQYLINNATNNFLKLSGAQKDAALSALKLAVADGEIAKARADVEAASDKIIEIKAKTVVDDEELQKALKDLEDKNLTLQLTIEANTRELVKEIENDLSELHNVQDFFNSDNIAKAGDELLLNFEQAQDIVHRYPELLGMATEVADGVIHLDQKVVDGFIKGENAKRIAMIDNLIARLEIEGKMVDGEIESTQSILEIAKIQKNGKVKLSEEELAAEITGILTKKNEAIKNGQKELEATQEIDNERIQGMQGVQENNVKVSGQIAKNWATSASLSWDKFREFYNNIVVANQAITANPTTAVIPGQLGSGVDTSGISSIDLPEINLNVEAGASGVTGNTIAEATAIAKALSDNNDSTTQEVIDQLEANLDSLEQRRAVIDGNINFLKSARGAVIDPRTQGNNSSKSGGGAGKSPEEIEAEQKELDDLYEHYRLIEIQLGRIETAKKRLEATTFIGNQEIAKLGKFNKLLEKEAKLIEDSIQVAWDQAGVAMAEMESHVNNYTGMEVLYNENGDIANYQALYDSFVQKYNEARDYYNSFVNKDGKIIKNDTTEAAKKAVEDAEEAVKKFADAEKNIHDKRQKALDEEQKLFEKERELRMKHLEQMTFHSKKVYELYEMINQVSQFNNDLVPMMNSYYDPTKGYIESANYGAQRIDNMEVQRNVLGDEVNYLLDTIDTVIREHNSYNDIDSGEGLLGRNVEDYGGVGWEEFEFEELLAVKGQLEGVLTNMVELNNQMLAEVARVFSYWQERINNSYIMFERGMNRLDHMKSIIQLAGPEWAGGKGRQAIEKITESQLDISKNRLTSAKILKESADAQLALVRDAYAELVAMDTSGLDENQQAEHIKILQSMEKDVRAAEQRAEDAVQEYMGSYIQSLEQATQLFQEKFNDIVKSFEEQTTGAFGSMDWMGHQIDYETERYDRYVDEVEIITQMSKLEEDMGKYASKNLKTQEQMKRLTEDIEKAKERGAKVTQFELDILRERFNLVKAEMELEDAKEAKDTMRLARDASGNWNYIYSASDQAQEDKEAEIEDNINRIRQMSIEHAKAAADAARNARSSYLEELSSLDPNDPQYEEKVKALEEQLINRIDFARKQYEDAQKASSEIDKVVTEEKISNMEIINRARELGAVNLEDIIGREATQLLFSQENHEQLKETVAKTTKDAIQNHRDLQENLDEVVALAGDNLATLGNDYAKTSEDIGDSTESVVHEVEQLALQTTETLLNTLGDVTSWADYWVNEGSRVIGVIQEVQQALIDLQAQELGMEQNTDGTLEDIGYDPNVDYAAMMLAMWSQHKENAANAKGTEFADWTEAEKEALWRELKSSAEFQELALKRNAKIQDPEYAQYGTNKDTVYDRIREEFFGNEVYAGYNDLVPHLPKEPTIDPTNTNIVNGIQGLGGLISGRLDVAAGALAKGAASMVQNNTTREGIKQDININVDFPGVTDSNQIEEAFDGLFNKALQFATGN